MTEPRSFLTDLEDAVSRGTAESLIQQNRIGVAFETESGD
jgi:hypothetical protein